MKRFVLLAFALGGAAACGDNLGAGDDDDTVIDAAAIDAAATDASAIDASPDAAPARFSGTITLLEASVLAPSPGPVNTVVAQGIQLGVTFNDATMSIAPVLDTMPGTPYGCKVTEVTLAQLGTTLGVDEGTVQFTVNNGGAPANPVYPVCRFVAGSGYVCPDTSSSQAITATNTVTLARVTAGQTSSLTAVGGATFDAADIGRYVKFSGTAVGSLNASHIAIPIVALGPTSNIAIIGTDVGATPIPLTSGVLTTLAGAGPMPGLPDPGQLADEASATAMLDGPGTDFPDLTINFGDAGDDFNLDDTNAALLRNIPVNGSAFTIGCTTNCGDSIGNVLNITTTDADLTGQSLTAMPAPAAKRVTVRCAAVGGTTVTVPANVSAFIMSSGATRIQANFVRASFGFPTPSVDTITPIIGHAFVGFTTPPVN